MVGLQSIVNINSGITNAGGNVGSITMFEGAFTNQVRGSEMYINGDGQSAVLNYSQVSLQNQNDGTSYTAYSSLTRVRNPTYNNSSSAENILIEKNDETQQALMTTTSLSLTDSASNNATLTTTDLTFNTVSLPSRVTKNTQSIQKLQYASPLRIANSPAIYGTLPSSPPMIPSAGAINSGFNGWYYKNVSSAYNNISWAMGFQPSSYVVSNLKGFYFTFVSLTTTSKPFMSVYTLPATPPNFYLSRRSYVPAIAPATITAGIPYIYYYMFDPTYPTPFKYCHTAVPLTLSGVNPVGPFAPNELLYFMSINTNSISAVGTEELIVGEGGCIMDDGSGTLIQPFSFNGSDVYSPNSYAVVTQGAGTLTPTSVDNGKTYVATANFTISNAGLNGIPAGFFIRLQSNSADRTITYNTSSTFVLHTSTGSSNGDAVIAYWNGTSFVIYQA